MKRKLKFNVFTGIADIVMAFLIMISWLVVIFAAFGDAASDTHASGGIGTFFYICAGVMLIIHIIAFVKSRKAGISIVGHVLGIIGTACFFISMVLAFPAFVLVVLAAIFTLIQKNKGDSAKTNR
ncbi:transporter [Sporolactobacillus sp. THM7-7]|nr:transporter [Sporolactobacillus sp. THM7-7]